MKLTNILRKHSTDRKVGRTHVEQRGFVLFNRLVIYLEVLMRAPFVFHRIGIERLGR